MFPVWARYDWRNVGICKQLWLLNKVDYNIFIHYNRLDKNDEDFAKQPTHIKNGLLYQLRNIISAYDRKKVELTALQNIFSLFYRTQNSDSDVSTGWKCPPPVVGAAQYSGLIKCYILPKKFFFFICIYGKRKHNRNGQKRECDHWRHPLRHYSQLHLYC